MKCDELKSVYIDRTGDWARSETNTGKFFLKEEVDTAIAELKQKLESVQASMYADVVDANMENRRLKRVLWFTRALRARIMQKWWMAVTCAPMTERACRVWNNVERKCQAKGEEYK